MKAYGFVAATVVYNRFIPQALWFGAGLTGLLIWSGFYRLGQAENLKKQVPDAALSETI